MRREVRFQGNIVSYNDTKNTRIEDRIDMEIHDAVDYITMKYITKGGKIAALPMKLMNEMSREQDRIDREKSL